MHAIVNKFTILSREDIEVLADGIIANFDQTIETKSLVTPIEELATNFLGLKVTFDKLSNDGNFCGVTAYRDSQFKTFVDGYEKNIKIQKQQIILDSAFMELGKTKEKNSRFRFTLAHEIAHQIIFQLESEEDKLKYDKSFSIKNPNYRFNDTELDWNEWQANTLGAALLMPRDKVKRFLKKWQRTELPKLPRYLHNNKYLETLIINKVSEFFSVSKQSAKIRLQHLGYIKEEKKVMGNG